MHGLAWHKHRRALFDGVPCQPLLLPTLAGAVPPPPLCSLLADSISLFGSAEKIAWLANHTPQEAGRLAPPPLNGAAKKDDDVEAGCCGCKSDPLSSVGKALPPPSVSHRRRRRPLCPELLMAAGWACALGSYTTDRIFCSNVRGPATLTPAASHPPCLAWPSFLPGRRTTPSAAPSCPPAGPALALSTLTAS